MFEKIPAGKDLPNDFNVIIEIPAEAAPVKYEYDKEAGMLVVDRFMPAAMHYPCNYGFIPQTLADDGDPADALVLSPQAVQPGSMLRCRPLGLLKMTDESGEDGKILAVPIDKICAEYINLQSLEDVSPVVLERIAHFFEHYKKLEPNKWVKVNGWEDKTAAERELLESAQRYAA